MKALKVIIPLLILDQLTKILTLGKHLSLTPFFSINSTTNTGTLFGLSQGNNFLFILLTLLFLAFLAYIYKKEKSLQPGLSFIFAGAVGNLLDRIFYGHVLDFLDFKIWPIFNFADAFLTFGILYCLYLLFRTNNPH